MLQLSFASFKRNSYILIEGTPPTDRFYIIQQGKAQCYHETPIPLSTPAVLGPGDFVGVIPCMSGRDQVESVVAMTDVSAIVVRRDQYTDLIEKNAPVALKIVRSFAHSMRSLNDSLSQATLKDSSVVTPELMFSAGSYYEDNDMLDAAAYAYYQYIKEAPMGQDYDLAVKRFGALRKQKLNAVYFEPTAELVRQYPRNTMIFCEGQKGSDMFIIQDGVVRIVKVVGGQEITLALLKKGDMFGEMALLDDSLRSATAIANENCKLMVVNKGNFNQMITTQPQYISKLTTILSDRIWSMYRQLVNTQLPDMRCRLIDMLALQIEKMRVSTPRGVAYHSDLTIEDLMKLCGVPQDEYGMTSMQLQTDQHVKIQSGKITVPDVMELIKQAAFYRKQNTRRKNEYDA